MKKSQSKFEVEWSPRLCDISELSVNPNNPKIHSEIGRKRLNKSLEKFGLAGSLVANLDGKIIDGHSRYKDLKKSGVKQVWVSFPSRQLTDKEYAEINAVIDIAKAGDPDFSMMSEDVLD